MYCDNQAISQHGVGYLGLEDMEDSVTGRTRWGRNNRRANGQTPRGLETNHSKLDITCRQDNGQFDYKDQGLIILIVLIIHEEQVEREVYKKRRLGRILGVLVLRGYLMLSFYKFV